VGGDRGRPGEWQRGREKKREKPRHRPQGRRQSWTGRRTQVQSHLTDPPTKVGTDRAGTPASSCGKNCCKGNGWH
jgi:hypothetical protein